MHRPQQRQRQKKYEPVEDLREKLNRMRLERSTPSTEPKPPPPDPGYNFLRDPLRGDIVDKKKRDDKNEHKRLDVRGFLKQPVNINVEYSSESGERKCTLDKTKIIQIPNVRKQHMKRPPLNTQQDTDKNKENVDNKNEGTENLGDQSNNKQKKNVKFQCDTLDNKETDHLKSNEITSADSKAIK
ncbi:hypothetical protein FQA39_LY10343 [Lamprigera yunnana]|nr:hypothetical protein FQA39_LY10343 [Lamprigera yunnana]